MSAYESADFFLLRRPLKPINEFLTFNENIIKGKEWFAGNILKLFSSPEMEEAIFIASQDLYHELKKLEQSQGNERKNEEKLLKSLYKYFTRMSTRCTPYGLFAGCSMGYLDNTSSEISFSENSKNKYSRLDMNYVAEIANFLIKDENIRTQIKFYPNTSLYKAGKSYRYVEYKLKDKKRVYHLSSVEFNHFIEKVLKYAKEGSTISNLASNLSHHNVSYETGIDFIEGLIESQILISEFEPTLTGENFFSIIIKKLAGLKGAERYTEALNRIETLLKEPENPLESWKEIKSIIDSHFVSTTFKNLIQTDLFFDSKKNTINKRIINSLLKDVHKLFWLNTRATNIHIETFIKKFKEKYEEQEIPLATAMDSEIGIGYGLNVNGVSDFMPLLRDLTIPATESFPSITWDKINELKNKLILRTKANKEKIARITESDLDLVSKTQPVANELPESAYLAGSILAESSQAMDSGNFKFYLTAIAGPSAANIISRFCYGNPKLQAKLQECLNEEEFHHPDSVFAEVIHLPKARTGNVLIRPAFRKFEIPYLGQSSLPKSNQIDIDDLWISIKENKIVLRSKRLNKTVIPRLTSAHNYSKGLPIYKFLCDLQAQKQIFHIYWDWSVYDNEPFLPRVEYKNIILSKARWYLKKEDYPQLQDKNLNLKAFFTKLRKELDLPRHLVLAENDNELLLDFDNYLCLDELGSVLRKKNVVLQEFLPFPDQCFVKEGSHTFTNEIIIPLKKVVTAPPQPLKKIWESTSLKRSFIPGSEWLYYKIWIGNKLGDELLTQTVLPFTEKLTAKGIIEKWFFVRFKDPEPHLGIRFYNSKKQDFWKIVVEGIHNELLPYLESGIIPKMSADTYHREIERYGVSTMEETEELFHADSLAVAEFLDLISGDLGEKYRWLFALKNIDCLLEDFNFSPEEKYSLLYRLSGMFYEEFNNHNKSGVLRHSLNDKYRANSKDIETILSSGIFTEEISQGIDCFKRRSLKNAPIVKRLKGKASPSAILDLIASYIHMSMNRTFISNRRKHELVIYHYLCKYYQSSIARNKRTIRKSDDSEISVMSNQVQPAYEIF